MDVSRLHYVALGMTADGASEAFCDHKDIAAAIRSRG